jgi:hypothetical protein
LLNFIINQLINGKNSLSKGSGGNVCLFEGTEFTAEEAKEIITTETPIPARDEDSHDILGTYRIVSDKKEMESVLQIQMIFWI